MYTVKMGGGGNVVWVYSIIGFIAFLFTRFSKIYHLAFIWRAPKTSTVKNIYCQKYLLSKTSTVKNINCQNHRLSKTSTSKTSTVKNIDCQKHLLSKSPTVKYIDCHLFKHKHKKQSHMRLNKLFGFNQSM